MEKKLNIETVRHSLSHILAAVVLEMYPKAKLGIGPAIENGFYYDFDLEKSLTPDDIEKIHKKMIHMLVNDYKFVKRLVKKAEAIKYLKSMNQSYKVKLAEELKNDEVSFYDLIDEKTGKVIFTDMCAGPHIDSTKTLEEIGLGFNRIAGAYWKGSEKNKMLQRIYFYAFSSIKEMTDFRAFLDEAEKRDHRKLGKELDLFVFSDLVGPGLPLYTPKGTIIKDELQKKVEGICRRYGFQKVSCPSLAKIELFKISGHADKFGDELFRVSSKSGLDLVLKPVQCPHQTQIYASKIRSYRDLPIRYMESDKQYRAEKTGEVGGLSRVFAITVEDGHSFCRIDQVKDEVTNMVKIIKDFYSELGMWGNHQVSLSVRDYAHPEKYIGDEKDWNHAEKMLEEITDEMKLGAVKHEGEAALYGPKIDFMFKDAMGRDIQIPTVQLDFATPKRFGLTYVNEEGKDTAPVMVHRAILGSYERFIALLIEHFSGAFPIWLAPVQAIVLPISSDKHLEYSEKIVAELKEKGIRIEIDGRNESVGKKIREAEMQKIPYMIIIGDKEISAKKVALRKYGEGDRGQIDIDTLIKEIC
jgi:threonyl-tRNA synthetase